MCMFIMCIFVYYVHNLFPKIDELRNVAKLSNAAVICVNESQLHDSILSSELHIDSYNRFYCDSNRHGGGVVCYIRNDLSYDGKSFFPSEIENIFFELLLPNTKPRVIWIIYRPPSQSDFLVIINTHFSKLDTNNNEIYILSGFNINLYLNNSSIFQKNNLFQSQSIPSDIKNTMNSVQFLVLMFWFNQYWSHILVSFPDRISQLGVIDVELSVITNLFTALEKSPELKEERTSKLDAVHLKIILLTFMKKPWIK